MRERPGSANAGRSDERHHFSKAVVAPRVPRRESRMVVVDKGLS
jgi:hypothetical protein